MTDSDWVVLVISRNEPLMLVDIAGQMVQVVFRIVAVIVARIGQNSLEAGIYFSIRYSVTRPVFIGDF